MVWKVSSILFIWLRIDRLPDLDKMKVEWFEFGLVQWPPVKFTLNKIDNNNSKKVRDTYQDQEWHNDETWDMSWYEGQL